MTYLRARYYEPYLNQFIQPDTNLPDSHTPADWNRYTYARDNPLSYTDPSGYCSGDPKDPSNPDIACWREISIIEATYTNIDIVPDNWQTNELKSVKKGLKGMTNVFGNKKVFYYIFNRTITLKRTGWWDNLFAGGKQGATNPRAATITFYNDAFNPNDDMGTAVTIHEFGHILDARFGYPSWTSFKDAFWDRCTRNPFTGNCWGLLNPQCKDLQPSGNGQKNPQEDFADTFTEYVWYKNGWDFSPISSQMFLPDPQRLDYMDKLIDLIRNKSNSSK